VLAFQLRAIGRFKYFCKEYFVPGQDEGTITKRELKCIPIEFVMQCIRHYRGEPITELDRKFQPAVGPSATFDSPLDF